jgi:transglutaminase-like putative cysteine protease
LGIALLTNLSFLPDRFASRFFLFIFLAMLLIVRMSIVQKQEEWRASSVGFSQLTGWMTLHAAVWFGVVVVMLAAFLPMKVVVSKTVAEIWRVGRTPVANLEDEFGRLFGAIPSRKDVNGRFFGLTLPFLGKISFGGEAVLWADTDYPSYWLSQTYSEYTPQGWIAGKSTPVKVGPDTIQPPRTDSLERIPVDQTLQLGFDTSQLLAGGSLDWVSRSAVVHTLEPKEFRIDLRDPASDAILPEDVRSVAATLRKEVPQADSSEVESFISRIVSEDLALVEYTSDGAEQAAVEIVTLTRKDPIFPEIVAWNLEDRLDENEAYSIVSFVSIASDDDLRQASSEYPRFITDHYLQLPPTLPERVSQLAARLTEDADTALDRATAIQEHLRSSTFTYSQDIEAPPVGADGVDHFLFNTRTGYSDYFASSMVVLLRAAGVPSRMAAGYGPGEYDAELDRRVIRDFDSHGWAQVYFPDYGWIDFEPTPKWPAHERRLLSGPGSDLLPGRAFDTPFEEDPLDDAEDPEGPLGTGLGGVLGTVGRGSDSSGLIIRIGIGLGAIAVLWLLLQFLWTRGLAHATPVERAYTKMSRMGTLAGIGRRPHETPFDYAMAIGAAIPSTALSADHIAQSFASGRYGGPEAGDYDEDELNRAWSTMRGPLVGRALSRFSRLGLGGQQR